MTGVSWIVIALGWYLIAVIWIRNLSIPSSVSDTTYTMLYLFIWSVLIVVASRGWVAYNRNRYFFHNKRTFEDLPQADAPMTWNEAFYEDLVRDAPQ